MEDGRVVAGGGGLSAELAATLEPRIQNALNHPARRQTLRALHSRDEPLTVAELHDRLPDYSRSGVSYHLQVLRDSGCVVEVQPPAPKVGREREVSSALRGDLAALQALEATKSSDLESLAGQRNR